MAMYRRTIREQLFKLLFRFDFLSGEEMKEQEELFFDSGDQTFSEADRTEITEKLERILAHREEIDREIAERKLRFLGMEIDVLTEAQREYLFGAES